MLLRVTYILLVVNKASFTLECSDKLNHHLKSRLRQYLSLFTCNKLKLRSRVM